MTLDLALWCFSAFTSAWAMASTTWAIRLYYENRYLRIYNDRLRALGLEATQTKKEERQRWN